MDDEARLCYACDLGYTPAEAVRPNTREAHMTRRDGEHFAGCLLGGAVGDALGAPVEFMSLAEIRRRFGPQGVTDFVEAYGRLGAITDDTQMTLFTAEGLLRGYARWRDRGIASAAAMLHHAYLRWLSTQGMTSSHPAFPGAARPADNGWLLGVQALHARRAPGNTCLSALCAGKMGTVDRPLNDSKGCGGVMRVAPVGLFFDDPQRAFEIGCEAAAITHGHPSGYLSAGCLAAIITAVVDGHSLTEAIQGAVGILKGRAGHEECLRAVEAAMDLASDEAPTPEAVETLGGGWVGEEALAISLYCALCSQTDYARSVLLAVNHSGDADSTGAITGNILGALRGVGAVPSRWLDGLELRAEIETVASDLLHRYSESGVWQERYPGY